MSPFSPVVTDFWHASFQSDPVLHSDDTFHLAVNPDLEGDRRLMMLQTVDGMTRVTLTPELADRAGITVAQGISESDFRIGLDNAGIELHGADNLFYFTDDARAALIAQFPAGDVRQLTAQDETIFRAFESVAPEQDLDEAQVELGHWAVFGSFDNGRLVAAASMYRWDDGAPIMDLGVLTLPTFRGKGHARRLVRAICRYAYNHGYDPQYRCQLDNEASAALAPAAGLTLFGTWDVISPG
ncbi:MAG: GNAT family N-acetyltransferase [Mycobacterium sp.]